MKYAYLLGERIVSSDLLMQLEYLLRTLLALFFGFWIGFERRKNSKSVATRTLTVVAFGAALFMVISKYGFRDVPDYDAARIAAQVMGGIGFLGAGVIFVKNNLVNGLTSAAIIWVTAGMGLALGAGMYLIGIGAAVIILFLQYVFQNVAYFTQESYNGCVRMTIVGKPGAVQEIEAFLAAQKVEVLGAKVHKKKKAEIALEFDVIYPLGFKKEHLLSALAEMEDVLTVSE